MLHLAEHAQRAEIAQLRREVEPAQSQGSRCCWPGRYHAFHSAQAADAADRVSTPLKGGVPRHRVPRRGTLGIRCPAQASGGSCLRPAKRPRMVGGSVQVGGGVGDGRARADPGRQVAHVTFPEMVRSNGRYDSVRAPIRGEHSDEVRLHDGQPGRSPAGVNARSGRAPRAVDPAGPV
jgi:hypothetical protein